MGSISIIAVLIIFVSSIGYMLVRYRILRDQVIRIVETRQLNKSKTYYSIGGIRRFLVFSFTDEGLLVIFKTNVLFPGASLIKSESIIKYDQINKIDIGQLTTTMKLAEIVSSKSILFRYNMEGMASFMDGPFRMVFTSKKTRENFKEELKLRGVNYQDVSMIMGNAVTLILVTLLVMGIAASVIYFTVL